MMATSFVDQTVGELVAERIGRSRLFEQLGIDYCCGGNATLETACERAGVDLAKVCDLLAETDKQESEHDDEDWANASINELIDNIVSTHHVFLRSELPRLLDLSEKVFQAHGANHPELSQLKHVLQYLTNDLLPHMQKEEQILFPICRQISETAINGETLPSFHCGSVKNPIRMMEHEHDMAGKALREIRALTRDFQVPEDACSTYQALLEALAHFEADLHLHIHKENNILFPQAAKLEDSLSMES